jgi:hypothetical protein
MMAPSNEKLNQELDALRVAGHVLSPWGPADPELVGELDLLDGARQCVCACGLVVLAGWNSEGAFTVVPRVGGAYGHHVDPQEIAADLEARKQAPSPAALWLADFHASAGYQRFAECYND